MKRQTGVNYESSTYAKALCVAEAKVGKSCFLVGSILGCLPQQKHGGVVDKPSHLHVFSFDQGALTGVGKFLTESCGAPKDALNFRVYNFQDDVRRVALSKDDYDFSVHGAVIAALAEMKAVVAKEPGVHALMISSMTGLIDSVQRGLFGPPDASDGQADQNKWGKLRQLVSELRNYCQIDEWHCFWEGHIFKEEKKGETKESLAIQGASGKNFAFNVEQVFRVRRMFSQKFPGTNVDQTYLDTQPALDFISNGRSFNESLAPKEPDLTIAFHKLGLKVGRWNNKK